MNQVPSYSQLQEENEEEYQQSSLDNVSNGKTEEEYIREFLLLVNKPFPAHWLKKNKFVGNNYIPIDKLEFLLTRVFGVFWNREILSEGVMFNSPFVRVRLHYKIPGTDIWRYHDGAGATPAKVSSGAPASDMGQILSSAIQTGYPSAASYALSNAAERIGKLFGRGLNKDDAADYDGIYDSHTGNVEMESKSKVQLQYSDVSAKKVNASPSVKEVIKEISQPVVIPPKAEIKQESKPMSLADQIRAAANQKANAQKQELKQTEIVFTQQPLKEEEFKLTF